MKKSAVVVIPVYKETLSVTERVSLTQAVRVLGDYDICFLAPVSLDISSFCMEKDIRVERFDDCYFASQNTYSEMMLLPELYERFQDYDYMLLYQLDAFVFSDRLAEFCAMGYDYIAAPNMNWGGHWHDIGCSVGVGGLSLRKIDSAIRVCRAREYVFQKKPAVWTKNEFLAWEDLFFAFCSKLPEMDYHVPDFHTALDFAVTCDLGHAYQKMPKWMPFGCHQWDKCDYWHWKPYIEQCGYGLPEPRGMQAVHSRQRAGDFYVFHRVMREDNRRTVMVYKEVFERLLNGRRFAFWGWGKNGKCMMEFCNSAGCQPVAVFDRNAVPGVECNRVPILSPDVTSIRRQQLFLLITTTKYEDEISEELTLQGLHERQDFMRMSDLQHRIYQLYVNSFRANADAQIS